jgi:Hint domain-containing protein
VCARALLLLAAMIVTACGGGGVVDGSPTPSAAPTTLGQAALKYRIVDQFGRPLFCDPDFYPVARGDEEQRAHQQLPEIQKDVDAFAAITAHLGLASAGPFVPTEELSIYRDWKMLRALQLAPALVGYRFSVHVSASGQPAGTSVTLIEGTIDPRGVIAGVNRMLSTPPACPICLAIGTRIATPSGDVPVQDLRVGDFIWTFEAGGARVAAALVAVGSAPVPPAHEVTRLVLSDGRALDVSPGHPDAAGRAVGELVAGDPYDGAVVVSADRVRYAGGATFDVLPAGDTGLYRANGVLLASTLRSYSSIAASSAALFTALSP